jgi:NAD(P)-dependent dehydrogenase (short-subunit alcohol dehydrogenase family)
VELGGHVAIVTGGSGALGQAVTWRLLAGGANVCVPWVVDAEAARLRESVGAEGDKRVYLARADVADPMSFDPFVREALARFGRLDILVNGVGGFEGGDLVSTPPDAWARMLTMNLTTTYVACHAALPSMVKAGRGRVVNIASRAVVPPRGGFIGYTVAKSGVIALTQALAEEVRSAGITVNAVLPSTMDTPANRRAMPDADRSQWVPVESVAETVAFLAGDGARHVTGALVTI